MAKPSDATNYIYRQGTAPNTRSAISQKNKVYGYMVNATSKGFQQIGVVDAVAPYVEPFTPSEFFGVDGQLIRRMTMVEPPYPQGYTPSMVFTQPPVERLLRERVAALRGAGSLAGAELCALTVSAAPVSR